MFKSGFVSIVGRPNAGKSTLLNQMLKTKLAIMSDVAQTTRNTIQGIYTDEDSQIVFIDTPGVHKPQDRLGSFMNTSALNSIYGADVILFIAPANEKIGKGDHYIINRLKEAEIPVYLVLNKVDLLSKEELIQKLMEWQELFPFKEIIPISAKTGLQVDHLISILKDDLNEGPKYYEDDQLTDHPERFIIAEFIREKILHYTHEEVPHSVAILIDKIEEDEKEHRLDVIASIVVTRDSQKGIIIGKQGALIKKIRLAARKDIRQFLGMDVDLELFVKVEKDWRNKEKYLKELGYNEDEY
ncbi:MAG: GTPase Era [Beduini sp.]|uniref:GTPase Era n=1 Tax=Beduini sp. TaxID=1922300 RepID=UPI0011CBECCC